MKIPRFSDHASVITSCLFG